MVGKITIGIDGIGELANGFARCSNILIDSSRVEQIYLCCDDDTKEEFVKSLRAKAKRRQIPRVTCLGRNGFGELLGQSDIVIEMAGKDLKRNDGLEKLTLEKLVSLEKDYEKGEGKTKEERLVYRTQRVLGELEKEWWEGGDEIQKSFIELCFNTNPTKRIKQALPVNMPIAWEKGLAIGRTPKGLDKHYLWFPNENILTGNIALQIIQAVSTDSDEVKAGLAERFLTPCCYDSERIVSILNQDITDFPSGIEKIPIVGLHDLPIPFLLVESIMGAKELETGLKDSGLRGGVEAAIKSKNLGIYYPKLLEKGVKAASKAYKRGGTTVANAEVFPNIDCVLKEIVEGTGKEVFYSGYFHPFIQNPKSRADLNEKFRQTEEEEKKGIFPGIYYIGAHFIKERKRESEILGLDRLFPVKEKSDLAERERKLNLPEQYFGVEKDFIIEFLERFWGTKEIRDIYKEYTGTECPIVDEKGQVVWPRGEDLMVKEPPFKGPFSVSELEERLCILADGKLGTLKGEKISFEDLSFKFFPGFVYPFEKGDERKLALGYLNGVYLCERGEVSERHFPSGYEGNRRRVESAALIGGKLVALRREGQLKCLDEDKLLEGGEQLQKDIEKLKSKGERGYFIEWNKLWECSSEKILRNCALPENYIITDHCFLGDCILVGGYAVEEEDKITFVTLQKRFYKIDPEKMEVKETAGNFSFIQEKARGNIELKERGLIDNLQEAISPYAFAFNTTDQLFLMTEEGFNCSEPLPTRGLASRYGKSISFGGIEKFCFYRGEIIAVQKVDRKYSLGKIDTLDRFFPLETFGLIEDLKII